MTMDALMFGLTVALSIMVAATLFHFLAPIIGRRLMRARLAKGNE
jgi:hypothetical protein